jgi:dephospho-CoA kinase
LRTFICVTGMPGAGKSVIAKYLAESLHSNLVSMGDVMRREALKRGMSLDLKSMMEFAKRIREERGEAAVADLVLEHLKGVEDDILVIDGVRSLAEIERFSKEAKVIVVAVHASPRERFRRLRRRGRKDDPKSWAEFRKRDLDELRIGIGNVIALADVMIVNEDVDENLIKDKALEGVRRFLTDVSSEDRG